MKIEAALPNAARKLNNATCPPAMKRFKYEKIPNLDSAAQFMRRSNHPHAKSFSKASNHRAQL